ncbi:MAG TPA: DnaJ domain-containing protein [Thermoanaerobaculia bacterium]|jgi:curved DNA-binding protein CbpA
MVKNFYQVMGVERNATQAEITARFRELVRERHPDRFEGEEKLRAEKDFQDITEAFNVLRDARRRGQHDSDLDRPAPSQHDPGQTAKVYLGRGVRAYKTGNYLEAADNFDRATQAEPGNAQAWHHLALTCYQEERWLDKARDAIEQAVALRADHTPYVKLAARIYVKSGMVPKAKEYYNSLLRLGGFDATVRQALEAKGALGPKKSAAESHQGKSGFFRKTR